jgi:hypothetical protein
MSFDGDDEPISRAQLGLPSWVIMVSTYILVASWRSAGGVDRS